MNSFYSQDELSDIGLKSFGDNVLISKKCSIYGAENISVGSNVRIDDFCILSGNINIGNYIHISAAALIYGSTYGVIMEDFTGISSRCAVYAECDDLGGEALTNSMIPNEYRKTYGGQVIIKKHVLIGTGSTVLPGICIEEGSIVAAMSLVNKSLKEWGIYIGRPCKKLRDRSKELLEYEIKLLDI